MAKGSRASSIKANNVALKSKVFGPVETARTARLSAKLLELAAQPKPEQPKVESSLEAEEEAIPIAKSKAVDEMEVDQESARQSNRSRSGKGRIERKRSSRKASIVFPKSKQTGRVTKSTKTKKK